VAAIENGAFMSKTVFAAGGNKRTEASIEPPWCWKTAVFCYIEPKTESKQIMQTAHPIGGFQFLSKVFSCGGNIL